VLVSELRSAGCSWEDGRIACRHWVCVVEFSAYLADRVDTVRVEPRLAELPAHDVGVRDRPRGGGGGVG